MPTTAHTYQAIGRFDPALSEINFDDHDAAFPREAPDDVEPSAWRRYCASVDESKHDPSILETTGDVAPIVYTLRPMTRPDMEWASEIQVRHGWAQYCLAISSVVLVSVDGPKPVTAAAVAALRRADAGLIRRIDPGAPLWSDDDVMPDGAMTGLVEHASRRWNLSRRERTFRRASGKPAQVG